MTLKFYHGKVSIDFIDKYIPMIDYFFREENKKMQPFYCANCGTRLSIARKALPAYGKIIHIVEFHECSEEPIELDLTPVELPEFKTVEGKDRFIRHIDELIKPLPVNPELRDRRSAENVKTTAPMSVLDEIEALKT